MSDDPTAISGVRKAVKELVDGTLRVQIDIEPRDKAMFHKLFPEIDTPVALAPMKLQPQAETWGQEARQLVASGFFMRPDVWRAVADDKAFLFWLRDQQCAAKSADCQGQVVPAHVRRVKDGSGIAMKPPYSAIPLCDYHHGGQHQSGESAVARKDWWDQKRVHYVSTWARDSLKYQLGYESWKQVPPPKLYAWAIDHNLAQHLPECYRE